MQMAQHVVPPFEDFHEAHLHQDPPHLDEVPAGLAALIDEFLYKAPGARPLPANVRARLDRLGNPATPAGLDDWFQGVGGQWS